MHLYGIQGAPTLVHDGTRPLCGTHVVERVRWRGPVKELAFADGALPLRLPRSCCVTSGDTVELDGVDARVRCLNGSAQLLPIYVAQERLKVGATELAFVVKEI